MSLYPVWLDIIRLCLSVKPVTPKWSHGLSGSFIDSCLKLHKPSQSGDFKITVNPLKKESSQKKKWPQFIQIKAPRRWKGCIFLSRLRITLIYTLFISVCISFWAFLSRNYSAQGWYFPHTPWGNYNRFEHRALTGISIISAPAV